MKMPETEKLVSVGMPVYNGAGHLREALDSLLSQTYKNLEIVLSDNASTDGTPDICREYAKKDRRFRFVRQKENIGAIPNFEFVKREARGGYFMWAAHDDLWDKRFIEKCAMALREDRTLVLAMSDFNRFDPETGVTEQYLAKESVPEEKEIYPRLKHHILMYLNFGKGVPIYGLWRREMVADIPLVRDWSYFPVRFVFGALFLGGAAVIRETLFFKRAPLLPGEKKSLVVRMWLTFKDRVRKVFRRLFYANILTIVRSERLSAREKAKLILWQLVVIPRLFLVRVT